MKRMLFATAAAALVACSRNPAPSTSSATCAGTRVLAVNNGGEEAVVVYALNGRTSTEVGTVPVGKKELTVPPHIRATSFYAIAVSRLALSGSPMAATNETRVTFVEDCRPK